MAMAGGSFHAPQFTVAWPTGEIGPMGLEGAVRLGFRKELDAQDEPTERNALFDRLVGEAYARGRAINAATTFELDEVIDPAETRAWITTLT
jgi:acetyl-CoA carboxylase carboxyltransferase component